MFLFSVLRTACPDSGLLLYSGPTMRRCREPSQAQRSQAEQLLTQSPHMTEVGDKSMSQATEVMWLVVTAAKMIKKQQSRGENAINLHQQEKPSGRSSEDRKMQSC